MFTTQFILQNINLNLVRGLRKVTFPYRPKIKDLYLNPITKVVDRDLTPENKTFLDKVVQNLESKSPLKNPPWPRAEWTYDSKRTGLIAKKIGQFPQWLNNGRRIMTTLLQIYDNHVISYKSPEEFAQTLHCKSYWKGRYGCLVVGAGSQDPRMFNPAYNALFCESGLARPKMKLARFVISPSAAIQPGTPLSVNHFKVGHFVDVEGKTIFHGFQGVMTRWGFAGGPGEGRGNTKNHRRPGSFGGGKRGTAKSPGTVMKGTRMAGLMGGKTRCARCLRIWRINTKHNVMYVHGYAVPGPINSFVKVFDSRATHRRIKEKENAPPFPTYYADDHVGESLPEDILHPDLFDFSKPSLDFVDAAQQIQKQKK